MNDFELRRELRGLRGPREPQQDLWPRIAQRLEFPVAAPIAETRRAWIPLALAAGMAVAVTAGIFAISVQRHNAMGETPLAASEEGTTVRERINRAHQLANTGDPRLAGAEVVVDAANEELELALQQQPDAVFLVGLINRTHAQKRKLARLGLNAG
jgi:hypothetical protein